MKIIEAKTIKEAVDGICDAFRQSDKKVTIDEFLSEVQIQGLSVDNIKRAVDTIKAVYCNNSGDILDQIEEDGEKMNRITSELIDVVQKMYEPFFKREVSSLATTYLSLEFERILKNEIPEAFDNLGEGLFVVEDINTEDSLNFYPVESISEAEQLIKELWFSKDTVISVSGKTVHNSKYSSEQFKAEITYTDEDRNFHECFWSVIHI